LVDISPKPQRSMTNLITTSRLILCKYTEADFDGVQTTGALLKFGFETYRCTGPSPGVIPKTSAQNA